MTYKCECARGCQEPIGEWSDIDVIDLRQIADKYLLGNWFIQSPNCPNKNRDIDVRFECDTFVLGTEKTEFSPPHI